MTKTDRERQRKAPILRFKGFTDDWEQRQLNELGNIKRGASPRPISDPKWFDKNGKYGWLRISDVTSQNGQVFQIDQHLSSIGEKKTVLISDPHLIISIAATVGKPCINYIPTAIHDGFVAFLDYKFNLDFMFEWFNKNQNIWLKYGQPGAQINLNSSIIGNQKIKIPKKNEQGKIAKLLNMLNNLLVLYERKVKLLLQIKKYLLNNLFSEKEYPDLRFKYSKKDNWKKISLSSVLTYKNGKAHEKEINNKGNLDLVMMNSITTEGRLITKKKIFSPQDTLSKNDIVIVLSDIAKGELIGKSSVIPCDDQYVLNQRIGCLRPTSNIDSFFVSKYINQKSQYFKSHAAGTSQINLSKSDVLNCTIYIPNIDEQHYVSNFIINIEKNINFYKDKKQCFIEIKNTLLNNMFI